MPAAASEPAVGCDAQSMLADREPVEATEAVCAAPDLERDHAYLIETARPGATMLRQGMAVAVARLHPVFVRRLAGAISEARDAGLSSAGIFSAYRPPAFGVGRFSDKFNSLHTYGLAVDMLGVGRPGSSEARLWYDIAARHGIVCPYGAGSRREWNHCQPTRVKSIVAGDPLRGTVSPQGPIELETMFAMGDALVNGTDPDAASPEPPPIEEKLSSRNEGPPQAQQSASRAEAVQTHHDQTDPVHAGHGRLKAVAGSLAHSSRHEAHGQPKRRIVAENASGKGEAGKKYRTASLLRREASVTDLKPVSSHEHALAKRVEAGNARVNRSIKGICRGC